MKKQKQKDSERYQCWLCKVSLITLTFVLFLKPFYNFKNVRYFCISNLADKFIKLCRLHNLINFISIQQDNSGMTSKDETEIYLRCYQEMTLFSKEIVRKFNFDESLSKKINNRYNRSKIDLFFKQEVAREIEDFLTISSFMKWYFLKEKGASDSKHILLIKHNLWIGYLAKSKRDLIWKIFTYPDIVKGAELCFVPLKIVIEIIINSFLSFLSGSKSTEENKRHYNIAVMHAQGADLQKKSDYFWFQGSSIDPERVLVYFKYGYALPGADTTKLIDSYGMKWVNLLPIKLKKLKFLSRAPEFYKYPHPLFVKNAVVTFFESSWLLALVFLNPGKINFWQWARLTNLLNRVTFYETFFLIHNVKVHYALHDIGVEMTASNIAIELVDGLDVSNQWSNYWVTEIIHAKPHDVFFGWGQYYKKFLDKDFYRLKYLIYSGYLYDNLFEKSKDKGQLLRQQILKKGASFIVSFFDEATTSSWPKEAEDMEELYRVLLEKVIADPTFGLITKPKRNTDFWKKMPNLGSIAKECEKTGRTLFLQPETFANEAAQAADLVIGYGVYNTPALEAALSGIPAITCDIESLSGHAFYNPGLNGIVFNNLEKMLNEVEKFKERRIGSEDFGNYSFFLENIDPFRDGKSAKRIGDFLKWLLDEFDKGAGPEDALIRATEKYRNLWGSDKVVSLESEQKDFFIDEQTALGSCCAESLISDLK